MGAAAFAGAGGGQNLCQSNYIRDKGFGMGRYVPRLVSPVTGVEEAAALMKDKQIRRLVVRGADGELAGVVSLGDLACDGDDEELAGETLEAISEPAAPVRLKG